jgi:hypothetical protein
MAAAVHRSGVASRAEAGPTMAVAAGVGGEVAPFKAQPKVNKKTSITGTDTENSSYR